jgi:chemotaxis protein CheX
MAISESDVRQLTSEIWGRMLQIELAPSEVTARRGAAGIGACVQITGAWEGAVRVDCSMNLARLATSRFLATEPEQVGIDQIRDAIGELANMSAGSVKPLLPKPCQLSLSSVADGSDYTLTVPQGQLVLETASNSEVKPLKVSVVQPRAQVDCWTNVVGT